jgi:hypothetical protein
MRENGRQPYSITHDNTVNLFNIRFYKNTENQKDIKQKTLMYYYTYTYGVSAWVTNICGPSSGSPINMVTNYMWDGVGLFTL